MTEERSSHRRILVATSLVGGATFAALLIGLARNKAIALIGGPEAIGLLGLFTALVSTAGALAMVGLDTSAVRQMSVHIGDPGREARSRTAISTLALMLAVVGGLVTFILREPIARLMFESDRYAEATGWLAIGVAVTVLGGSRMAVIQAYGRIGDIARVRLLSSLLATLFGVAAIYRFGLSAIAAAVIAGPIATFLLAHWYGRKLPAAEPDGRRFEGLPKEWRALIALGLVVAMAYAVSNLASLATLSVVTQIGGLVDAGLYQASSAIISVNLTLLLNAMTADYYPRLSKVHDRPAELQDLLNQQMHVSLVLSAPVFIIVAAAAPLLLQILYSSEFARSAFLLRLLCAAAVVRLAIWSLSYLLLARGDSRFFLFGEICGVAVVPATWLAVSAIGLPGAGVAVVLANSIVVSLYLWRARAIGVRMSGSNLAYAGLLGLFLFALALLFEVSWPAGLAVAALVGMLLAWRSAGELRRILGI